MEKCPTCSAACKGNDTCARCKMDLRPLLAVEKNAAMHFQKAWNAYAHGDFPDMLYNAKRSFSLKKSESSARLLAVAALANKNYPLAVNAWRYIGQPVTALDRKTPARLRQVSSSVMGEEETET